MALEEKERLYEVLIRYHPDGTVAAHYKNIVEVFRDGVAFAATEGDAKPLNVAVIGDVLGEVVPAIVAERDKALSEVGRLLALNEQASLLIDARTGDLATVTAERDAITARLAAIAQAATLTPQT